MKRDKNFFSLAVLMVNDIDNAHTQKSTSSNIVIRGCTQKYFFVHFVDLFGKRSISTTTRKNIDWQT